MPSEATLRRLAFIRYLYRLGLTQVRAPEPLVGSAILMFHDAIELFLHLASEVLDVQSGRDFMDYFKSINDKLSPGQLAQQESIMRLNKSRVSLKHAGTFPSRLDLEDFETATGAFFAENTPLIFGIPLESVSLAALIVNEQSRDAMRAAESAMGSARTDRTIDLNLVGTRDSTSRSTDRGGLPNG